MVVTLDDDRLVEQVGTGTLDTGHEISAAEARRLTCDAQLLPAVLGSAGQMLDAGSHQRLHPRRQRIAIAHRDGGCSWTGRERPPGRCQTHHLRPWHDRGPTTVENGALFCGSHHRLLLSGDWSARLHPVDQMVAALGVEFATLGVPRSDQRVPTSLE